MSQLMHVLQIRGRALTQGEEKYALAWLEMGFPIQVSTASLLRFHGRRRALKLLTDFNAVLVSDCHNTTTRPPDLGVAVRVLEKKLGGDARDIVQYAGELPRW